MKLAAAGMLAAAMMFTPGSARAQNAGQTLKQADIVKLLPASVFYRGQSATTQLRNSGGVKFDDGFLRACHPCGHQRLLHRCRGQVPGLLHHRGPHQSRWPEPARRSLRRGLHCRQQIRSDRRGRARCADRELGHRRRSSSGPCLCRCSPIRLEASGSTTVASMLSSAGNCVR